MPISSALGSSALLPAGLGFRNKIINGDMRINQRGASTTSTNAGYLVDRWRIYLGTALVSFNTSTDAPDGFTNSVYAECTTASATPSSYYGISQQIEGYNVADLGYGTSWAKPAVVSFWVKSTKTGLANFSIGNDGNTRSYNTSYTINIANTWEKKTIYINGDTTGTWAKTTSTGFRLWWDLGSSTSYNATADTWVGTDSIRTSGQTLDITATLNARLYLTGVQLEQNYQPTPFEQRPIGVELALCQRYYYLHTPSVGNTQKAIGVGVWYSATQYHVIIKLAQTMRAQPTLVMPNGTGYYVAYAASAAVLISSLSFESGASTTTQVELYAGGLSGGTAGYASMFRTDQVAGSVAFSAEL